MSVVLLLLGVNGLNRDGCICFCFWAIGQRWLIALRILEFVIDGPIGDKATDIPSAARDMCGAKRLVRALVSTSPNGIMLQGFYEAVGAGSPFSIIIWSRMRCSAIV